MALIRYKTQYIEKIFMYKSICHNDTYKHYSAFGESVNKLVIGEYYDVYFGQYAFSDEYEIYQNGTYYTSFLHVTLHNESTRESDETFLRYFYNKEQMRTLKINTIID